MNKQLKAYIIHDNYEGYGCVRFATNSATARREGACELDTDWESIESCRRAPHLDQFSPGPVPPGALIESGWWFECHGCGARVSNDEYDEDGEDVAPGTYVARKQQVFCCQECLARDDARKRMNLAAQNALIELVEAKFFGCTVTSVHVYGEKLEASEPGHGIRCKAYFTYPGATHLATYHYGEGNTAWVPRADEAAFVALFGTQEAR
ncbi:hypothetical protein G3O00_01610 [Burkholderia sp. Ac-20384]|uniref:hypothetical protein n=1 Tax=Burkholderia sp. Ac-20384 TaxID=2703902 RepID=UPI00197D560E|nr:hypothetical protein [Burkholderia sp. Ac-20384]MBN3822315.1 hypothetical protein [Burkholderia sp. Ac-20384]